MRASMDPAFAEALPPSRERQLEDLPLFGDPPAVPEKAPLVRVDAPDTSRAAAQRIAPHAKSIRERVADAIVTAGLKGMTRSELALLLDVKKDTINARVRELLTAAGAPFVVFGQRHGEGVIVAARYAPGGGR